MAKAHWSSYTPLDICPTCKEPRDSLGRCGCDYNPKRIVQAAPDDYECWYGDTWLGNTSSENTARARLDSYAYRHLTHQAG